MKVWCCAHAASSKPGKPRPDIKLQTWYIIYDHGRRAGLASHQTIRNKYNLQPAGRSFTWRGRARPSILGQSFAGASKISVTALGLCSWCLRIHASQPLVFLSFCGSVTCFSSTCCRVRACLGLGLQNVDREVVGLKMILVCISSRISLAEDSDRVCILILCLMVFSQRKDILNAWKFDQGFLSWSQNALSWTSVSVALPYIHNFSCEHQSFVVCWWVVISFHPYPAIITRLKLALACTVFSR